MFVAQYPQCPRYGTSLDTHKQQLNAGGKLYIYEINKYHLYSRVLFGYKEEWYFVICRKMDETEVKQVKPRKTNIMCFLSYVES